MFHYRIPRKEDLPMDQGQDYLDMNAVTSSISNCEVSTKNDYPYTAPIPKLPPKME